MTDELEDIEGCSSCPIWQEGECKTCKHYQDPGDYLGWEEDNPQLFSKEW